MYLWFKVLHIFFIISWFAGLFYLPRIYVNLAEIEHCHSQEYQRLLGMAWRLYKFMTPLAVGAVIFGFAIPFVNHWWNMGWVHLKATIGIILIGYHLYCYRLLLAFQSHQNRHTHRWYRVFNEIPVILMIVALYAVVFKPF